MNDIKYKVYGVKAKELHKVKGIEVFNKLIKSSVGETKQQAKYLFAQFMLGSEKENEALSIIYELANQKYYPALIFLGNKAWRERKIILAEEYFLKVSDSYKYKRVFGYLYELYAYPYRNKEKPLKYRDKEFTNRDKIYYLEKAEIDKNIYLDPEFDDGLYGISSYAYELALIYFEEKHNMLKLKIFMRELFDIMRILKFMIILQSVIMLH